MKKVITTLIKRHRQLILYAFFGLTALAVDLGIFFFLTMTTSLDPLVANIISIFSAMTVSFVLNAWLNFKTTDAIASRFASFFAVNLIGLAVSFFILYFLNKVLDINEQIAKLATLPFVFIVQYLLNKKFTFAEVKQEDTHEKKYDMDGRTVAVIGGGFTGLTTAYRLAQSGANVTIYEASPELGGLAKGFALNDGTPVERAYHFLYKTDSHLINLCKELGIETKLKFYPTQIAAIFGDTVYPFNTAFDLLKFSPLSISQRIRTGLTGLRLMTIRNWEPLTNITAYEWLCKYNGKAATDIVWKPLLKGKFAGYWDSITMAWLWTRIKVRQDSQDALGKEELGYFDGGFAVVVDALTAELKKRGVSLKTNTKISSIKHSKSSNKPTVVLKGKTTIYDAVVSTIPSPVFASLTKSHPHMKKSYAKQLNSVDYLSALLCVFTTNEPITDYYWHQIHNEDAPFLVLLSLSALVGPQNLGGNHVYYIGDYIEPDDPILAHSDAQVQRQWFSSLTDLMPSFDPETVTESHVFRFKDAQHIVGTDFAGKIPDYQTPLEGVFLANFTQIFPEDRGTNYAVREGDTIARLVMSYLDNKRK